MVAETRFDTDKLGTFSREIKRPKSQLATARIKIRKGMKLLKTDIGIASEGTFGSHPLAPIPWNVEIVLLYDKKDNLEICGIYEGSETNFGNLKTNNFDEALKFAEQIGFPEHFLILRPDNDYSKKIIKNIDSVDKFKDILFTVVIDCTDIEEQIQLYNHLEKLLVPYSLKLVSNSHEHHIFSIYSIEK